MVDYERRDFIILSNILWVTFHEVPEDVDAFDVSVVEGIVMSVFTVTLNDLQTKTNAVPLIDGCS